MMFMIEREPRLGIDVLLPCWSGDDHEDVEGRPCWYIVSRRRLTLRSSAASSHGQRPQVIIAFAYCFETLPV